MAKNEIEEPFRFEFDKNSQERVVLQFTEYQGHQLFDLRVFWSDLGDGGKFKPGKKGLTINVSHLGELCEGINKAVEYLQEHERAAGEMVEPGEKEKHDESGY